VELAHESVIWEGEMAEATRLAGTEGGVTSGWATLTVARALAEPLALTAVKV
jgi:hypothetical protein